MRRQLLISLLLLLMFLPLPTAAQSLRGTVLDRETGAPVPNARLVLLSDAGTPVSRTLSDSAGHFSIPVALKGFYSLEVSTGAHDNLDYAYSVSLTLPDSSTPLVVRLPSAEHVAATLCETPGGIVAGSVIVRDDSVIAHNVKVVVEWEESLVAGEPRAARRDSLATFTNARGKFRICGIPVNDRIVVRAETDSGVATAKEVRIPPDHRLASVELVSNRKMVSSSVLSGFVIDESRRPIMQAEVSLPAIEKSTVTNERGRFQLAELPPGQYDVRVRRIGYRELSVPVSVPEHGAVEREMVLSRVAVLDTVAVQASVVIPSFEENRRIGLGKFLTRADLEKQENRKLAEILEQVGAKALRNGHRAWIGSGRGGQKSIMNRGGRKCAQLEGAEPRNDPRVQRSPGNPGCGCFALVFMNDALIYNGETGATVPDVNSIVPASIEAIEFYKGPASTPLKYSRLTSECGVLVLHTRRTLGKTSTSKP